MSRPTLSEIYPALDDDHAPLSQGDRVDIDGEIYLLAQVMGNRMSFISLTDANRWSDPVTVGKPRSITRQEAQQLCGTKSLKSIRIFRRYGE